MCLGLMFLKVHAKDWDNGNVHGLCVCDEVLCVWAWEHRAVLHTSSCFKDVAPRVFLIHDVFFPCFSTQTSQMSCLGERSVKCMECFEEYFSFIRCGGCWSVLNTPTQDFYSKASPSVLQPLP